MNPALPKGRAGIERKGGVNKKVRYYLNRNGEFVIENYHLAKPFSSFFPGIAGLWGIPAWVFYVNRGQGIASFGIRDKDHPIMEFHPANKSYQLTSLSGFRTFVKVKAGKKALFYDVFQNGPSALNFALENKMFITSCELRLREINHTLGLETEIEYFTIPNDNYAALARRLTIRNLTLKDKDLGILDGMPQIIPYGTSNFFLKELSRTVEAWALAENLKNNIAFLRLSVDPADRPEVVHIKEGNFYLAFSDQVLLKPIVDPEAIFGQVNDFTYPAAFLTQPGFAYPAKQLTRGKTPCCMGYKKAVLKKGQALTISSIIGSILSLERLKANSRRIANEGYLLKKQAENKKLIGDLQSNVFTHSRLKNFDLYCAQNFLDNLLRGGYPLSLGSGPKRTHIQVYSRKHGDLERDYNKFVLEPAYFSQGNGNYRDVNQNRRSDVWFNPQVKDENILNFFNLIQADGYNPLVIKPDNFIFKADITILGPFFSPDDIARVNQRLKRPFTPGELFSFIEQNNIRFLRSREEFLDAILANSLKSYEAEHGEGFWTDHWAYCLDLLESYLSVYPENLKGLLLEKKEWTFFDNWEVIRPRAEKYILKNNRVFQYHAVVNNHTKHELIRKRLEFLHLSRSGCGTGEIYKTSLIVKMLVIIANKFASLDPFGTGIEMEANKPNWFDSLNGLPGLLGSSICETFELKRWLIFLQDSFKKLGLSKEYNISIPEELHQLIMGLKDASQANPDAYGFWDKTHTLKEAYLKKTLLGYSGQEEPISIPELSAIFGCFLNKINSGLEKAYDKSAKLHYSYFINEVTDYKLLEDSGSAPVIMPLKFKQVPLPLFLEGPMHYLRVVHNQEKAREVFAAVRKSRLYDKKLKMYKVSAPLETCPEEIGRCRNFTPGWLENESVWLHMEYKYILELLKNGLYKEFFDDFKNVLIPFQDPCRYGRSILENSSFLVSSAFPDERLHGNGFVARLSGSTAEFISIWLCMCVGGHPFYLDSEKKLCLEFKPILPGWLFSQKEENGFPKNTFAFKFLNKALVVYHNPGRKDTFGKYAAKVKEITIESMDKNKLSFQSASLIPPIADEIRQGRILRIDILLS